MSNIITAPNVNFKTYKHFSGKYKYTRINLNNITGSNVPLSATASSLMEFKLPTEVYNLGRSYVSFTEPVVLIATANNYSYAHDNTLAIADRIQFGSASGNNLLDLNYANNYIAVARPIDTPLDVFESNDVTSCMYTKESQAVNFYPVPYTATPNNIYGLAAANPGGSATVVASSNLEPMYLSTSVVNKGLALAKNFPLSGVVGTILSMDRDQFFGQEMYLRINTAVSGKVAFTSNATFTNNLATATQPILNNVCLYLAVEKDVDIISEIMGKYASGQLKYQIPSVTSFRNAVAQGGSTVQIQLNNQYGKKLKRVLTTNFNNTETLNTAYDHHNWNAAKVSTFQTYIGSNPLQESLMSCAQPATDDASIAALSCASGLDDWRENAKHCKDSAITSSSAYQLNWFHADTFNERNSTELDVDESNLDEGLSLAMPLSWSIRMNVIPASAVNYTFCEFIKDIQITPAGPVIVDALAVNPVVAASSNMNF